MKTETEVVIVGASVAGAATALGLARRGVASTIVEKQRFPRFHIGESLTGGAAKILRELGFEQAIVDRGCYVKRGVRVYGPGGKSSFWVPVVDVDQQGRRSQGSTWHVTRSEFDAMLLERAKSMGVTVREAQALGVVRGPDGEVAGVRCRTPAGEHEGELEGELEIGARVVVDASGAGTFLANAGVIGPKQMGAYCKQLAIFAHVRARSDDPGTVICYQKPHHWAWYIPLTQDTVSVGVVTPGAYYREQGEDKDAFLRREIASINPELTRRLPNPELVTPAQGISNYSYHIPEFTGRGYLCVGDSHRFIDPIFSLGVNFALREADLASDAIASELAAPSGAANPFLDYQAVAERSQDLVEDLIDAFWGQPLAFAFMAHKSHQEQIVDVFAGRIYRRTPELDALHDILRELKQKPMSQSIHDSIPQLQRS